VNLGVLTVLVAVAPSLFLLTFFYLKDRYERERSASAFIR
jgi:RsiW-degrading membrane proteinase PrsW (M82 family)